MKTEALRCFREYVTLKLHFNEESFEWRTENFKRLNLGVLLKRNDSFFFEKMTTKYPEHEDRVNVFVSAFLMDRHIWIRDIIGKDALLFHKQRMRKIHSLESIFVSDCENIENHMADTDISIADLLKIRNDDRPAIVSDRNKIIGGVTDETLSILDKAFCFTKQESSNPQWAETRLKLRKYKRFLEVPKTTLIRQLQKLAPGR